MANYFLPLFFHCVVAVVQVIAFLSTGRFELVELVCCDFGTGVSDHWRKFVRFSPHASGLLPLSFGHCCGTI
jgi:hypothetical protein